jgi:CheY-like chemotaxis protein
MTMDNFTILHVEDDPNDVVLFRHAWQKIGLAGNLRVVGDGDEAVAYLTGAQASGKEAMHPFPSLILLDLKMPRVNGFEVLAWLRRDEKLRRVPVVVLSSSNHEADISRAYDAGANSFLVKPVDFNRLVELVKSIHHYWLTLNEHAYI